MVELHKNLVSVVIPVYNSEKFLAECIESVLNQSYPYIEAIAVDDGSTDRSLEILNKYSDKIRIIHQQNKGLASALNTGISQMDGKWFKWFSPDDVMYQDSIETLVETAKSHDKNTIIYSNWDIIDEQSKVLRTFYEYDYNSLEPFDFAVRLLDGQQINANTTLIPSYLFEKCTIQNLQDAAAIDYNFFLNVALNYSTKFVLVKKPLIKYRVHTKQFSHKNITKTLSFLDELKKEYLKNMDSHTRERYVKAIYEYQKNKPLRKQALEVGLGLLSKLPTKVSDSLLVYYLNQIRTKR